MQTNVITLSNGCAHEGVVHECAYDKCMCTQRAPREEVHLQQITALKKVCTQMNPGPLNDHERAKATQAAYMNEYCMLLHQIGVHMKTERDYKRNFAGTAASIKAYGHVEQCV